MTSRQALQRSDILVAKRRKDFSDIKGLSDSQIIMLDVFYREALNKQSKLRSDFLSKRSALEQLVGMDSMTQFESVLEKREQKTGK